MRFAATLSLLVFLSAPMLAEEPLAPGEVDQFITAATEVLSLHPVPPGIPPTRHLIYAAGADEIARSHGFSERRWRAVAQRVLTAHHVERLVDLPVDAGRRPVQQMQFDGMSGELRQRADVASTTREDLDALAVETAADRQAIRPFGARLDALVDRF